MDEIRCPMCGNLNPSDLEECQYCQARLKPLIVSQPTEEVPDDQDRSESSPEDQGIPDWLRDLREREPTSEHGDTEAGEESSLEEAEQDDWLARLKEQSLSEDEERELDELDEQPFEEEDFLSRLREGDESEPLERAEEEPIWPGGEQASDEEDLPAWLNAIGDEENSFEEEQQEEVEEGDESEPLERAEEEPIWSGGEQASDEEDLPAWLNAIGAGDDLTEADQDAKVEEGEEGEPLEQAEEEPVWPGGEQVPDEEDLPAWMSEINALNDESAPGQEEPEIETSAEGVSSQEDETLPDWFSEIESVEIQEEPSWMPEADVDAMGVDADEDLDEELPDADDEEETEEPEELELDEEQPDWLSGLEEDVKKAPVFEEQQQVEAERPEDVDEAELPDWLADLQSDESGDEDEEQGIPDWLAGAEIEREEEAEEELPDWMIAAESAEEEIEISEEEAPEWLSGLEGEEIGVPIESPSDEPGEGIEEGETPEWLAELEQEFSQEGVTAFTEDEDELDELAGETPPFTLEAEEEFLEELPDWAEEVPTEEEITEEQEPELEEAELPSWLEAMRPVETVAPETYLEEAGEGLVETSGPLAGLSGILVAESDFARVRKPPTYSVKLRVTENQQARIALLRDMLSTEDKPKALPGQPVITPQYIFRLVIALALVIPILWTVISAGNLTPMPEPASAPAGVLDFHRQVETQLSGNSPVLIAFDYEAGFSGELDIPARAVISHLMEQNAYLTLVSTSPSGPILAERLLDRISETGSPYGNFANMGLVPGGTAGLLSLAQAPSETIPYSLDNLVVWESAPLNLINTVADFSMVIVITENSETARAWIEQVNPFLQINETPLVMILSAQAEPLVRPYYEGVLKQVDGLVVGLPGGAAYESVSGQNGLARRSWDAFSLSIMIVELVLVIGAAVGLGRVLFISSQKEEA